MSRTDIGAGGHCSKISGKGNQGAGRGRTGSRGVNVNDDRNFGSEDLLDNDAHRTVKPAWRIELNQKGLCATLVGFIQFDTDEISQYRVDDPGDTHHSDIRRGSDFFGLEQ